MSPGADEETQVARRWGGVPGGDMALPFSSRLRGVNEVDGCGGPSSNTGHGGGVRGMLLQGG